MPIAEMPQVNRMHAVPQNIMDVEFKLIGDLTIRQFIYLLVFGGTAYVTSVTVVGLFKWPLVILFALLGVGLAFIPIEERGLDEWIVNFIKSVYSPTQMIWKHEPTLPSAFMYANIEMVKQELITLAPTSSRRKLEEYLEFQLREEVKDPLDIPEKEYIKKVRDAFADMVPSAPSVGVSVLEPEITVTPEYPPAAGVPPTAEPEKPAEQKPPELEVQVGKTEPSPAVSVQPVEIKTRIEPSEAGRPEMLPKPAVEAKPTPPPAPVPRRQPQKQHPITLSPITPDMHAGRRFINLVPNSGELILPIRGERVIRTSEQTEVETDIREKAEKLQQLLSQIRQEGDMQQGKPTVQATPTQPKLPTQAVPTDTVGVVPKTEVSEEAKSLAQKLESEKNRLAGEISRLQSQKESATNQEDAQQKDAMIRRLQLEKERTQTDFEALQRQILELQNKIKEQEKAGEQERPKATIVTPTYTTPTQQIGGKANVVSGIIRFKDGSTKEGILMIMKNQKGEAVRALKTNSLGQFKLSTPLSNGIYTIEVATTDTGSTFDIISLEAKGEPIPPISLIGH